MKSRLPLLLAAVGILLRIFPAWSMPLWYDENFTLLLARLPWDKLIAATAGDVHPPLWYLICWPLAHIPGLPGWMIVRLPALVFGILSIWVWWKILQVMAPTDTFFYEDGYRVRLVAFALFCFLPQQIYYSQEGRMYSLLTLLVLLCWLCILRRQWIWLAVTASAMLWLHNYGLIYAAVLWIAALVYDRRMWKPLTIAMGVAGLAFTPWVIVMFSQMGEIAGNYWIVRITIGSILSDLAHTFFAIQYVNFDMLSIGVFYGVLTWVLIWSIRHKTVNLPAIILAFLPFVLVGIVSLVWQPIILMRALTPCAAFLCLILAEPVEYLGRRPLLLLGIFFIPALLINLANVVVRSGWASGSIVSQAKAMLSIDDEWQEGDLLYYVDDGVYVSGAVSWKHIDNILHVPQCGPVRGGLAPKTEAALGMVSGPLPENITGRIWVITSETPLSDNCMNEYLEDLGLLHTEPLYCAQDNKLVQTCTYLVEP